MTRPAPADRVFFTAAALMAAGTVPIWVAQWQGALPIVAPGDPVMAHGHEMLLGFAGALMAGFLFTRLSRRALVLVFGQWLAARIAMATGAPPWLLAVVLPLHPLALAWYGARPFLSAAKSLHNAVPGLVLGGFLGAEGLYLSGLFGLLGDGERRGVMLALALVAAMLFVMGGRLIPAASAGALRSHGLDLPHRVQRPLEMSGVAALAAMALGAALAWPTLMAGGATVAGLATLARLARWRGLRLMRDGALWPLHLGTLWLGLGLLAIAAAETALWRQATAVHAVTIGALGTLGTGVALRTLSQRARQPMPERLIVVTALLIAPAALTRLAGAMWAAAALWSAALLVVAVAAATGWRKTSRSRQ